uniref:DNA/RNA-binding domain-containing protein n=1 Tax=Ditylenchus dipsaci TaxID=166011 RepID=A0A915E239_9BILA
MQILKKFDKLTIANEAEQQDTSKSSVQDPNTPLELKKKIKKHLRTLALLMEDSPHLAVSKPKTMLQREIICKEFEKLMDHEGYKQEALDHFWRTCLYEPIKACLAYCSSHSSEKAREHIRWLKTFISCGIGQLSALLEKHPDLNFVIFIYLGDLYRYSYSYCGDAGLLDLECSKQSYLKALQTNPSNGRSFNQIALLYQENQALESLRLFLRALVVKQAYSRAVDNIKKMTRQEEKRMDEIKFGGDGQKVVLNIVENVLLEFNRQSFENMSSQFEKHLDVVVKENLMDSFKQVHCLSLMAISVFRSDTIDDIQLRCIGSLICRSMHTLLDQAQKTMIEQPAIISSVTDNLGSASEASDTAQHSCELFNILISVAEFLGEVSHKFVVKKIPVALKIQFKNMVQTVVSMLNHPSMLPSIICLINSDTVLKQESVEKWLAQGTACLSSQLDILVYYIRVCLTNPSSPISFDKQVFKAMNNSTEKDLGFLHKISHVHQQHFQEQQEKDALMPVYVMPHHQVLLNKLSVLQNLIKSTKLTVIIQPSVLSQLDKLKKESQQAREAIRWLEATIPRARVRMSNINGRGLEHETEKFLADKNLLDRQSLFAVILVGTENPVKNSQKPAIAVENIDAFFLRMAGRQIFYFPYKLLLKFNQHNLH